jgi:hypothetical protein
MEMLSLPGQLYCQAGAFRHKAPELLGRLGQIFLLAFACFLGSCRLRANRNVVSGCLLQVGGGFSQILVLRVRIHELLHEAAAGTYP